MSDDFLPEMEMPPEQPMDKDNPPDAPDAPVETVDYVEKVDNLIAPQADKVVKEEEECEPPAPIVKPIMEDEEIFADPLPKKKRVASKKQLEHLVNARKKAQETKRLKKEAKDKEKAIKQVISKEIRDKNPKQQHTLLNLSKDDLQDLTERAIEGYDNKRKARKVKKREQQDEAKKIQSVHTSISRAVKQPDPDDMWGVCFQ